MRATPMSGGSNTITSLPPSPVDERHGRMIRYSISMGIRMVCFIAIFFVPDWWRILPAVGAIVLPYIAVVLANAGHDGPGGEVERPGGVELYRPEESASTSTRAPDAPPASGTAPTPGGYEAPASGSVGDPRPDQR